MRYKCPHCAVECLVIDGVIEPCADHAWAIPEPMFVEPPPVDELQVEASDGLSKR